MYVEASDFVKDVVVPLLVAAGGAVLSDGIFRSFQKQESERKKHIPLGAAFAVAVLLGGGALLAEKVIHPGRPEDAAQKIQLQRVECQPCSVRLGDPVTITASLNRAVPHGDPSFIVHLNPSDGAVINGNTAIEVKPDLRSATTHFQVVGVPAYQDSINLEATDESGSRANATIFILKDAKVVEHPPQDPAIILPPKPKPRQPDPDPGSAAVQPKPVPINPELLDRLGEAQANARAEKQSWAIMLQGVPAPRPEITSKLYAADSTSKRCEGYKQGGDAASLSSCIDSLNEKVGELRIMRNAR